MLRYLSLSLIVASTAMSLVATVSAQVPGNGRAAAHHPAAEVLGWNRTDCGHVIDLLVRNSFRRTHGANGLQVTQEQELLGLTAPGDLVLMDVLMAVPATPECGPVYQVRLRNDSRVSVERFRVSLVAVFGTIRADSPCANVLIPCLKPGEIGQIQVTLPVHSMGLGQIDGCAVPFNRLVVAIDSLDELVECNELNNVAILPRAGIGLLVGPPVESTVPAVVAPRLDAETLPDAAPQPGPETGPGAAPADPIDPPQQPIDLDKLDFGETEKSTSLLIQ